MLKKTLRYNSLKGVCIPLFLDAFDSMQIIHKRTKFAILALIFSLFACFAMRDVFINKKLKYSATVFVLLTAIFH